MWPYVCICITADVVCCPIYCTSTAENWNLVLYVSHHQHRVYEPFLSCRWCQICFVCFFLTQFWTGRHDKPGCMSVYGWDDVSWTRRHADRSPTRVVSVPVRRAARHDVDDTQVCRVQSRTVSLCCHLLWSALLLRVFAPPTPLFQS